MKITLLALNFFLIGLFSSSGSPKEIFQKPEGALRESFEQNPESEDWTFLKQTENVKVYFTISSCDQNPMILFKVVNENDYAVSVEWESGILQMQKLIPVDKTVSVDVEATTAITGSCGNERLTINPYNYVSWVKQGETSCSIINLKIEKK
jgi:hypothetical protein